MGAGTRSTDVVESPRARLALIAKGAAYLLFIGALVTGLELVLNNPMTALIFGAVVVSFATGRAGVVTERHRASSRQRALRASSWALMVVAVATVCALALGGSIQLTGLSATFIFGLAESAAVAYRDELWLHGITIVFALRVGAPRWLAFAFAVLASLAVIALRPGVTPVGFALTATSAAFFALLWLRGRDAWAPVAAHFTWAWCSEALLNGELFDLVSPAGRMARAIGASGAVGWVAVAGFAVLSALLARGVLTVEPANLEDADDG